MRSVLFLLSLFSFSLCLDIWVNKKNKHHLVIVKALHSTLPIRKNWADINDNKKRDSFEKIEDLNYIPGIDDADFLEFLIIQSAKINSTKKKAILRILSKIKGREKGLAEKAAREIQNGYLPEKKTTLKRKKEPSSFKRIPMNKNEMREMVLKEIMHTAELKAKKIHEKAKEEADALISAAPENSRKRRKE